jgi:2-keto-3-deoxy-galactonokinase
MTETTTKPQRSVLQMLLAYIAIGTGMMAFTQAGMRGHRVGWEEMMMYTVPAVVCALLAIAMRRNVLGFVALVFGAIAVVGFVLGA